MEAPQPICSFSGAHPFRPQCLQRAVNEAYELDPESFEAEDVDPVEHVLDLVQMVDRGECPSCGRDLPGGTHIPAGSRLTRCRCVPVCTQCGTYEPLMGIDVTEWPMRPRYVERVIAHLLKDSGPGTIALTGDGGDPVLITEDGVTEIIGRPNPGGWAEFGYDDTEDEQEQAGR